MCAGTLNSFGIYMGFQKGDAHTFSATAETDCLLYTWTIDELATIATELAPAGKPIRSGVRSFEAPRWSAIFIR